MVMKTTELAALLGACTEQAQVAMDCAHANSLMDWNIIWECAAAIKDEGYDYDALRKKLKEFKKAIPQNEDCSSNPDSTRLS